MRLKIDPPKFRIILLVVSPCLLITILTGCGTIASKFVRKPKDRQVEEIVLVPEDYSSVNIPTEDRYRRLFLFWKSWQEELVNSLDSTASHKRRKSCIEEAIKNLEAIKPFLFEEKQKDLNVYLERLNRLKTGISQDINGAKSMRHKSRAESLKRNILRDFSYPKVKDFLK